MERYYFSEEVQTAYERLQHPLAIFQCIDNKVVPIVLSDGFCEMFGCENQQQAYQDIYGKFARDLHPDDFFSFKAEIMRFLSEGDNYNSIFRSRVNEQAEYKMIRAVGKLVNMENDINLYHIWFTDESEDVNHKIADLRKSVQTLLDNMPAMFFSKDVVTGKYMSCNQAFADYAHKDTPNLVAGLTDFEIFDINTATHFVDDDKKALQMDKPYIFYEDVPDAAGNMRRFQTTKLKFIDASDRECLLGLCQDITDAMQIKMEYDERLANANNRANIDALTGIRNKSAYIELEKKMNALIIQNRQDPFAVTVFDVNNLKEINDTLGHKAGDEYICSACRLICQKFKHSPVYRIGGDEFVAISEGEDYENLDGLLAYFADHNEKALKDGGLVVACGTSRFNDEKEVLEVFKQADKNMYENKLSLKKKSKKLKTKAKQSQKQS